VWLVVEMEALVDEEARDGESCGRCLLLCSVV